MHHHIRRVFGLFGCAALLLSTAACSMSRQTTTDRTAIEVALLTRTADTAIAALEVPDLTGYTVEMDDDLFDAPEKDYIYTTILEKAMLQGAVKVVGENEPNLHVQPQIDFAHVDDSKFLIGIPELPIPIPGAGVFSTPEIVIFGRDTQRGRTGVQAFATDLEDGSLVFTTAPSFDDRNYSRWRFLLFFSFRTTNLGDPF